MVFETWSNTLSIVRACTLYVQMAYDLRARLLNECLLFKRIDLATFIGESMSSVYPGIARNSLDAWRPLSSHNISIKQCSIVLHHY